MPQQRRTTRLIPIAALCFVSTGVLKAQSCLGLATLSTSSRLLSTTASGTDLGRSVTARYGLNTERLFGGLHLGVAGQKFARLDLPVVGGDVVAMIPIGTSGVQLCPVLQATYQNGPNSSSSVANRLSSSLGLSLGRSFGVTNTVKFIPFVQGGVQYLRQRYGYTQGVGNSDEALLGAWGHTNMVFGEMATGFGLQLGDRLTLTPKYSIPLGRANSAGRYQQTYSLGVTFGIPR